MTLFEKKIDFIYNYLKIEQQIRENSRWKKEQTEKSNNGKKKLLYLDFAFHQNTTKSNTFLDEILKVKYDIYHYNVNDDLYDTCKEIKEIKFDICLIFQLEIDNILKLKNYFQADKYIYVPMCDQNLHKGYEFWKNYTDFYILNFSKTLYNKLCGYGLNCFYLQYFPKPMKNVDFGNEKAIYFWSRQKNINLNIIQKVLGKYEFDNLYYHGNDISKVPDALKNKIIPVEWQENKNDALKIIEKSAIYFAPRIVEGIGMSFLDAMAMGRCVIAHDGATMNEYIINGKNGFLYNANNPTEINIENVKQIQQNTLDYIEQNYKEYEKNKFRVLEFI